jgi:ferredoxin, 2Fe-2S
MPNITYVNHAGESRSVEVPIGWSVMAGAIHNDIDGIVAECGGSCACGTCHVYVYVDAERFDELDDPAGMERDMLECTAAESTERSWLSCQIKISTDCDGLLVHLPERQTWEPVGL